MAKVNRSVSKTAVKKPTGKRGRPAEPRVESVSTAEATATDPLFKPLLPPDWMLKEGKEVWDRIYPTIRLHPGKGDLFAAMCQRFGHATRLERLVKKSGHAHKENTDGVHEANISKAATSQWLAGLKLAEKLGITTLVLPSGDGEDPPAGGSGKGGGTAQTRLNPEDEWIFNGGSRPNHA